jgi:hypothetical protein
VKTASFTVRGSMKQLLQWKRAADAEGYASPAEDPAPLLQRFQREDA